jgi:hypothetical protein
VQQLPAAIAVAGRTMKKPSPLRGQATFSWQMQEEPHSDDVVEIATLGAASSRRRWLLIAACALLVLLVGFWGGQRLAERSEANLAQVEREMAEAIVAEAYLLRPTVNASMSNASVTKTPDRDAPPLAITVTDVEVTLLEMQGSLALVDLLVKSPDVPWQHEPYRMASTLRQGVNGWVTTTPNDIFWGERHTLDTTYFHVEYSQRDADAVMQVAPKLDALYLRLHADLDLPTPKRDKSVTVHITTSGINNSDITDLRYSGSTLVVPAPDLIPRPPRISNANALHQSIAFPLAVKIFTTAQEQRPRPCEWHAVVEGIGLWLRWEEYDLPSKRRWEFDTLVQAWRNDQGLPRLNDLIAIPQDCWQPPPYLEMELPTDGPSVPRNELAATLIEYMVSTYGRDVVPALLQNFGHYSDWDSLIPAVTNVSAADVEAGWHAHLLSYAP